ncbi:MAG: L-serine ammonia-lyase, iron-sulfur-dependent, subunit alpha [Lentisphaeria bacterium]|nr:L-serine ammonia-lyase, iron-sulfur-dependent, subunit alpha [Lentisphaeria bacterium]
MPVSIFNDVIGPVMRGPSSSHCAAALRIGRLARDLMDGRICRVLASYDREGALAATHGSQGSDMGLFAGLLGWEATDARLPDSPRAIREAGVEVRTRIADTADEHPNTYRLALSNPTERHTMVALSTGGGMIEIVRIDEVPLSVAGDYWETLVWLEDAAGVDTDAILEELRAEEVILHVAAGTTLLQVKAHCPVTDDRLSQLPGGVVQVKRLAPVLPVLSRRNLSVPFATCSQMLEHGAAEGAPLWKLAAEYESQRGAVPEPEVLRMMVDIVRTVRGSIEAGLAGTEYTDRILGPQSPAYRRALQAGRLLDAGVLNRIVLYVTALMEVKSAMGVIVAAPTAGACAALPGACVAVAEARGLGEEEMAKAMLAGGLVGVLIATRSTFAAEVCGCQAECGAASGMAAAALCTLAGGTACQSVGAASMALQSSLGLVCDPVANRVEVPCLGRNVMAASTALSCANMALAGFDAVIPLDEVIVTMDRVGRSLPRELRCTALGGLSVTPTSTSLQRRLAARQEEGA